MKSYSTAYANEISAPCRSFRAEFTSAHEHSYSSDYISSITIEAPQMDGKFFGYSISHKAKVVLLRNESRTPFTKGDWFTVKLGTTSQLMEFPKFYIDSIQEDAKTGEITLEGYDNVYSLNNYTFKDLNYGSTFTKTIRQIMNDIGTLLGVTITNNGLNLTKEYTQTTLNVAEDTPIRSLITNIAEVTGTILVNSGASGDNLKFIKLGSTSSLSITKSHYYESEAGTTTTLTSLASVNALGDTVQVGTTGYTQVIQDNAFLTNLDDSSISTMLTTILNGVVKTVCSYTLDWIGNPALEYGDRIIIDSNNSTITTNYLSINLQYNGGLKESISWQPNSETTATAAVNTSINSAISKTEAKVDKANQEITLTVAEISEAKGQYTTLKQKLDSIELEAGIGNVTFRQDTVPTGTSTRALLTGDLWFNTGASGYTNNKWYRYNGSTWDVLTDGELATATSNITNLTITTNGLSTSVQSLNTEVDGLDSRVETAESTIEQQAGEIALKASQTSVNQLTTVVNGKASQSDLDDLSDEVDTKATKTELNNLSNIVDGKASQAALNLLSEQVAEKADSATVTALTTRVTNAEIDIDGLDAVVQTKASAESVSQLSAVVDTKATQTSVNAIDTRVTSAEESIDGLEGEIVLKATKQEVNELTTVVSSKADQSDLEDLSEEVGTKASQSALNTLSGIVDSKASQAALEALADIVDDKADSTTVTALTSRVNQAEADIDAAEAAIALKANSSTVTELTAVVNGKASQSDLDDLSEEVDNKANQSDLDDLADEVDTKEDKSTVTLLTSRVTQAEVDIDGLEGEIDLKATKEEVTELSTVVDGKASQTALNSLSTIVDSKASQAALNALSDLVDDKADSTTVTALSSRVSTAEADIDAAEAAIALKADSSTVTSLTTIVNGKADQSDLDDLSDEVDNKADTTTVTALTTRVTSAEADIDGLEGEIVLKATKEEVTELSTVVDGKASQTALNNLSTVVDSKASQAALNALSDIVDDKADSTTVTALTSRVSQAEADIDAAEAAITLKADSTTVSQLTTVVSSKASQSDLDDLSDEVDGKAAQSDLEALEEEVDNKADTTTVTALTTRVTSAEADIDGLEGEISLKATKQEVTELATVVDGKADESEVETLDSRLTTAEVDISAADSKIALVVEETQSGNVVKAASIVTAINESGSSVIIDADHVELSAEAVTFTDLSTSGSTTISGDNITTGTIDTDRINTTEIFNKDSLELKVEDKGFTGNITVAKPSAATYWFPASSDGWRESNNNGVHKSYALAQASFVTTEPNTKITFEVYNDAELNYDFLEIGLPDKMLTRNYEEDSYGDLVDWYKGKRYTKDSPDIVQIDIPTIGAHFIEFKFIKDVSASTAPDKAGFKLIKNYPSSTISLAYGGIDIGASQSLNINGMVTFNDLENKGSTVINGSNITTGELSADRIIGGTIGASEIYLGDVTTGGTQGVQITEDGILNAKGGTISADLIAINNSGTIMSSTEVQSNNLIANKDIYAHRSISTPKLDLDDDNGHHSLAYPFASTSASTTYYIWLVPDSIPAPTPTQPTNWSFSLHCTTNGEKYDPSESVPFPHTETFNVIAVFKDIVRPQLRLYKSWSSTIYAVQTSSASHAENNIDAGYYFDPEMSTRVFPRTITSGITQYGFCIQDNLLPYDNNAWDIGSTNLKWDTIYARVGTIQTSDRNEKKDIEAIDDKYSQLFDKLNPVTYKFNDGHRTHVGLIAQEVEQALTEVGIDSEDFAGFVKDTKVDGSDSYGLRYDEFISILIKEVQSLKQEVERLKNGNMD